MFKSVIIFAICGAVCVAAADFKESEEVKQGAANSFSAALSKFSNAVGSGDNVVPSPSYRPKVFSIYTKGLTALGGGKPRIGEDNRKHSFEGYHTTVDPVDHKIISDQLTPEQTAEMTKPRPTYQYTEDAIYRP